MNEQSMRFRIGIFVLMTMLILAVLITLFGSFPTMFKRHNEYAVRFTDAPGVAPGTPVRRSGIRIGEVKSVRLDDETGVVHIELVIESQYTIRRSEQPTLVHGLLGGDTTIDFLPRREGEQVGDTTPVPPGEELAGIRQATVSTLINQASEVVPSTQETLNEMRRSMQRFEKLAPQMDETIREYRELAKATRETIPDLRRTNDEIQSTARTWNRFGERMDVLLQTNQDKLVKALESISDTLQRVGTVFSDENQRNLAAILKNVRNGSENLDTLTKSTDDMLKESRVAIKRISDSVAKADETLANLQQATKPMAERSGSVMKNLDESTDKLNKTLTEVRELLRAFNQGDGTVRRLLNDPALYNHLDDAACMITRILPRVDRMLKDMEVFADKLARHPESLGLGGVVHPSAGLKDAPSTNGPGWPKH